MRKAKKYKLIDRYSIDQNGTIFVRQFGVEKKFYEVISIADIEKFHFLFIFMLTISVYWVFLKKVIAKHNKK